MGIISRFTEIMKNNINAQLDKCEDPSKMIDQTLRELKENFAEVKKETAGVMAAEKEADRAVQECEEQIRKYNLAAENALKANNEEDARTILSRKQPFVDNLVNLKKTQAVAKENSDKMRQMYNKLANDIQMLETKRNGIKATVAAAKTQEKMNKISSGSKRSIASLETFDRMEDKANRMLDSAMAEAELSADMDAENDLVNKYVSGGSSSTVDDELAAMKTKLGIL